MPHVRRFGFSGVAAVGIVVLMLFGINPVTVLTGQQAEPLPHTTLTALQVIAAGEEDGPAELVGAVSREADGFWLRAFRQAAVAYPPVDLRMVESSRDLGCGMSGSTIGTFYCPDEMTIYVDMSDYADLVAAFPEEGHKAQGYLIGRAYGHHVQRALAIWQSTENDPVSPADELNLGMQAACYAGAWTKWAGLEELFDDPAIVRAIQSRDVGQDIASMPSRAGLRIPETYARPDVAMLKKGFDAGYGIPAAGSCRMERLLGAS